MNFNKTAFLPIIFCMVALVCCMKPVVSSGDNSSEISTSSNPLNNSFANSQSSSVRHDTIPGEAVIFFTKNGAAKAVTENGEVYVVKDPIEVMTPGISIVDIYIEKINDEPGYVVYRQNEMFRLQLPITCNRENAPEIIMKCYFASMLYNGKSYALSDFKINSITVKEGGNDHLIKFLINYDITPARYADRFSWYNPYSTDYGSPKTAYGLMAEVTLVGTDGMWTLISSTCPKTSELELSHMPISNFIASQKDRYIIFETDSCTYYCEMSYKEAEDGRNTTIVTSLNAYNQKNGEAQTLLANRDDQSFYFLDSTEDQIVLTSILSPPEASPYDGPMYVIDKNTHEVAEIECLDTYTVTNDGVYFAQKYNNQYSPVLHFYSYKTGEVTILPEADVYLMSGDQYIGQEYNFCYYKEQVLWTKGDYWYQLNPETKQVSEYVWK